MYFLNITSSSNVFKLIKTLNRVNEFLYKNLWGQYEEWKDIYESNNFLNFQKKKFLLF